MKKKRNELYKYKRKYFRIGLGLLGFLPIVIISNINNVLNEKVNFILTIISIIILFMSSYLLYRSKEENMEKDIIRKIEKERGIENPIVKIQNRRALVVILFWIIPFTMHFVLNKYPNLVDNPSKLIFNTTVTAFSATLVTFLLTKKEHINKELEDKKLKQGNYKFNLVDQFYRYVSPNVVYFIMLMFVMFILYASSTIVIEGKIELSIIITSITLLALYTLWIIYCNGFSTDKGVKKYIFIFIAWIICTCLILIYF